MLAPFPGHAGTGPASSSAQNRRERRARGQAVRARLGAEIPLSRAKRLPARGLSTPNSCPHAPPRGDPALGSSPGTPSPPTSRAKDPAVLLPSCRGSPGGAAHLFTDSASPAALIFRQRERLCQIFCQSWRLPAGIPGISTQAAGSRYFKHTGEALAGCAGKAEGLGFWQGDVGTSCSFWGTVQQVRVIPSSKISGVSASSVLADTWPKTLFPFPLNFPANGQAAPVKTSAPSCCLGTSQKVQKDLGCAAEHGGKGDKGIKRRG